MKRFNKATTAFALTSLFGIAKAFFPEYGGVLDTAAAAVVPLAVYAVPNQQ